MNITQVVRQINECTLNGRSGGQQLIGEMGYCSPGSIWAERLLKLSSRIVFDFLLAPCDHMRIQIQEKEFTRFS